MRRIEREAEDRSNSDSIGSFGGRKYGEDSYGTAMVRSTYSPNKKIKAKVKLCLSYTKIEVINKIKH